MKKTILQMTFAAMLGIFAVTVVAGPMVLTVAAAEAGQEQPSAPSDAPKGDGNNEHAGHH